MVRAKSYLNNAFVVRGILKKQQAFDTLNDEFIAHPDQKALICSVHVIWT